MATSMTPEEIQAAFDRFNEEFNRTGQVSKETAEALADAKAGIKNYTYQLNLSLKNLGQASLDLASSFAKGEQGASVYNNSIKAGAGLIDSFASQFGILGKIVGVAAKAFATYVSAANEQSDKLFGIYQQLSKVGAAGTGGFQEVQANLHQFGYTLKDLDQYTGLIKKNAETLALYNGTVAQGVQGFAKITQGFKESGIQTQLRLMGLSIEDINQGIAGYQRIQVLSGSSQRKTTAELIQGSAEYIRNLDLLSKLTGKSAESLQAEREARQRESAFLATKLQLQQKADLARLAGDETSARRFEETKTAMDTLVDQVPKELQSGIKGLMTGFVGTSKEAMATFRAAGRTATELTGIKERGLTMEEVGPLLDRLRQEGMTTAQRNLSLYQFQGKGDEFFGPLVGFAEIGKERTEAAKKALEDQRRQQVSPADEIKAQVRMRQAQESATRQSEAFVNLGVKPATAAMKTFSEVVDKVSDKLLPGSSAARGQSAPAPTTVPQSPSRPASNVSMQTPGSGVASGSVSTAVQNQAGQILAQQQGANQKGPNNNPGNLEYGLFARSMGAIGSDGKLAVFPDMQMGMAAADALYRSKAYQRITLAENLKRSAPSGINDVNSYQQKFQQAGFDLNKRYTDLSSADQRRYLETRMQIEGTKVTSDTSTYKPSVLGLDTTALKPGAIASVSGAADTNSNKLNDYQRIMLAKQDDMLMLMKANNAQNQKMLQYARG